MKYAIKPHNAAHATALNGVKTRVVIMHDTASAASFMPFKNVINNARSNDAAMMNTNISRFLDDNGSNGICNILYHIAGILESLSDVFILHQFNIISIIIE